MFLREVAGKGGGDTPMHLMNLAITLTVIFIFNVNALAVNLNEKSTILQLIRY